MYLNAAPDIHITIDDKVAEGDKVVTRWTATGTHQGEPIGIAPTGKHVTVTGMTIERYKGGKRVESLDSYVL